MSRGPPGPPGMTGSRGQETAATHAPPAGPEAAAAERGSAFPQLSHERARADRRTPGRLPSCTRLNGCLLPPCRKTKEALHELQGGTGAPSFPPALRPTEDPGRWGQDAGPRGWEGHAGCLPVTSEAACPPGLLPQPCEGTLRFSGPGVLGPDVHPQHPLLCWPRRRRPGPGPNLPEQNLMPPPPRAASVAEGTTCHGLAGQSWSLCS